MCKDLTLGYSVNSSVLCSRVGVYIILIFVFIKKCEKFKKNCSSYFQYADFCFHNETVIFKCYLYKFIA